MTYTIRAILGDTQAGSLGALALDDGQTLDENINVTPAAVGEGQKLEFRLYLEPGDEVYLTAVHLFVDVRSL